MILVSEAHLRKILAEFVDYYNHDRPHRSLGLHHLYRSLSRGAAGSPSDQFWAGFTMSTREQLESD